MPDSLPPDSPVSLHPKRILVIDDEVDIRESLEVLLSQDGYAVDLADSGTEGLRKAESGNYDLMLCERGIRTYETYTRNTMDISAIPVLKKLTHLPVLGDPSHGVGIRDLVPPMALAAVAAGADGLLMEMHPNPDKAMSDGAQSMYPEQLEKLIAQLRQLAPVVGRSAGLVNVG